MRGMEGLISITYLFRVSNVTYSYYPLFYPNPNIESILMSLLILFFGQFFFINIIFWPITYTFPLSCILFYDILSF